MPQELTAVHKALGELFGDGRPQLQEDLLRDGAGHQALGDLMLEVGAEVIGAADAVGRGMAVQVSIEIDRRLVGVIAVDARRDVEQDEVARAQ